MGEADQEGVALAAGAPGWRRDDYLGTGEARDLDRAVAATIVHHDQGGEVRHLAQGGEGRGEAFGLVAGGDYGDGGEPHGGSLPGAEETVFKVVHPEEQALY